MSHAEPRDLILMPTIGPFALMNILGGGWWENVRGQGLGRHQAQETGQCAKAEGVNQGLFSLEPSSFFLIR